MKVSFVIPTRNQAGFIRRCIDGCLAQRVRGAEVLVVDGQSTDGTLDVLREYGGRVRWVSEADSGQSEAVNKGIACASGDVVAWINSDDFYPDATVLPEVLAAFEADPVTDVVYGSALVVDADGNVLREQRARPMSSAVELLVSPNAPFMQPAVFFRRRLFVEAGGLRHDLHYAMDYDLWLRMFPRARGFRFLARPLACVTFHPGAKSIAGMLPQIRELGQLKRDHRAAFELGWRDRARLRAGMASLYSYWAAVRLGLRRAS
ncbi:glycosyltransferase family 2 protein [Anaeromyxobacter sp. SG17]|uniref:glycosyltransferase family 2 protein n=1 Tax=Anaeromyxobacter sp. SG17 TaxID=2925405 RepID=UPI001F562279|nr:glycosyltransferase family 2 protein [Anaeromyxobacter sp. SG17]